MCNRAARAPDTDVCSSAFLCFEVLYSLQQMKVAAMKLFVTACREAAASLRQDVEKHLQRASLADVLDRCAGIWPLHQAQHFASLALR